MLKLGEYEEKLKMYEECMMNVVALQEKERDNPVSKIFGGKGLEQQNSALTSEISKMAQYIRNDKIKNNQFIGLMDLEEKIEGQIQQNKNKDNIIKQLQTKNKKLQEEISLFKHLEKIKEAFIEEKLKFGAERERLYKDLENRIEKVLQLEERLD